MKPSERREWLDSACPHITAPGKCGFRSGCEDCWTEALIALESDMQHAEHQRAQSEMRTQRLAAAAQCLITRLDEMRAPLDAVCLMAHVHGQPYSGPSFGEPVEFLRGILEVDGNLPLGHAFTLDPDRRPLCDHQEDNGRVCGRRMVEHWVKG